ncbi:hypothetical protein [Xenorhabdus stockiae]|uniref:hypothetical protein n=1 Tax=Xenorhabdus stockiae TaxID=351614 RepID=UPI0040644418
MSFNCTGNDSSAQSTANSASSIASFAQSTADRVLSISSSVNQQIHDLMKIVEELENKIKG